MRNIQIGNAITNELAPLFRRVSRVHNKSLEPFELKAVDAHILACLLEEGALSVGEVSQILGLKGSTLTGALDRLEKRGFIERKATPGDRRSFTLVAKSIPAKMKSGLIAALDSAEEVCWGALKKTEQAQLLKLLKKANAGLKEEKA
jgi:DNA-binding MarR family transcriptional regulator